MKISGLEKYLVVSSAALGLVSMISLTGCSLFAKPGAAGTKTAASAVNTASSDKTASGAGSKVQNAASTSAGKASSGHSYRVDDMPAGGKIASGIENMPGGAVSGGQLALPPIDPGIGMSEYDMAEESIRQGLYEQAFRYAALGYMKTADENAKTLSVYAASQMTPIELQRMENNPLTDFERAVIGRFRAYLCAAQRDMSCVAAESETTARAFEAAGDPVSAKAMRDMSESLTSGPPVVAVLLPLSGKDRRIGRAMLGAALQAAGVYDHNNLGFILRFFDTRSSEQSIPALMDEVRGIRANLVLGPIDINESVRTVQHLPESSVMIGFSPNDGFIGSEDNVFQYSFVLEREVQAVASLIVGLSPQRAVAVGPENIYSSAVLEQVNGNLPFHIQIAPSFYPADQTDLRDVAKKIAAASPDLVFMPSSADDSERIASFLAQENLWCRTPGTPPPKAVADMRKFTTCISTSAWAPIDEDHHYKFIADALYLDYTDAAAEINPAFAETFAMLYHRAPSVHEILPYVVISKLRSLPEDAWQSADHMKSALFNMMHGQRYLMVPDIRQIKAQGTVPYELAETNASVPIRSVTVQ